MCSSTGDRYLRKNRADKYMGRGFQHPENVPTWVGMFLYGVTIGVGHTVCGGVWVGAMSQKV